MELLVALRSLRVGGAVLSEGEVFRTTQTPEPLIDKGFVRSLSLQEKKSIVGSYVKEAQWVFGGQQEHPVQPCRCCKGTDTWSSIHGALVCGRCHPPAKPDLVKHWLRDRKVLKSEPSMMTTAAGHK